MKSGNFFKKENTLQANANKEPCRVIKHDDIAHILSHAKPGSLVILDLDDTVGRVSQIIGLDPWFRFRLQQFISAGHQVSDALQKAVIIYNLAQLASKNMVNVDPRYEIARLIDALKEKGVKVIALTARNGELRDKTLELLQTIGVSFSKGVLKECSFIFDGKLVEIKDGVIFSDGSNKGLCLEFLNQEGYFEIPFESFEEVDFVDDSERNCNAVASISPKMAVQMRVWHYTYAENNLIFGKAHMELARVQETHLVNSGTLLSDSEAEEELIKINLT